MRQTLLQLAQESDDFAARIETQLRRAGAGQPSFQAPDPSDPEEVGRVSRPVAPQNVDSEPSTG
jgi:hypothetical protein